MYTCTYVYLFKKVKCVAAALRPHWIHGFSAQMP